MGSAPRGRRSSCAESRPDLSIESSDYELLDFEGSVGNVVVVNRRGMLGRRAS